MSDEIRQVPDEQSDDGPAHPRFRERRAAVEDQSLRSRKRKLIVFAALVLAVLLAAASTQSSLLDVDVVRVVGAERTQPEVLRFIAGIKPGTPLLGLDTGAAEARLASLPVVSSVVVSKSWRGVVTLEIEERVPIARINSLDGIILIGADGIVVDLVQPNEPVELGAETDMIAADLPADVLALPEISGAMFSTEPGRQVPDVLEDAIVVVGALPTDIGSITERVEITVDSLLLQVVGGGSIAVGDARNLDEKFSTIRSFLAQVDMSCLDTLNVKAPTVPVVVRNSGC